MSDEFIEDADNIFNPDYANLDSQGIRRETLLKTVRTSGVKGVYGQRFPTRHVNMKFGGPLVNKSQAQTTTGQANREPYRSSLVDPYTSMEKARFEDAFRADPIVRAAIIRKAQFMLGKRILTTLDVTSDLTTIRELADLQSKVNFQKQMDDFTVKNQNVKNQKLMEKQKQSLSMLHPDNEQKQTPSISDTLTKGISNTKLAQVSGLTEDQLSVLSEKEMAEIKQAFAPSVFGQRPEYSARLPPGSLGAAPSKTPTGTVPGTDQGGMGIPNIYDPKIQAELLTVPVDESEPEVQDVANLPLEKLQNMAIEYIMSNQEYQQLKNQIDQINKRVDFHAKSMSAVIQSFVGGRSALFIEKGADGLPADLKILNWARLGLVNVDPDTWQLQSIQYTDFEEPNNILLAEDILYFPSMDFHITANTLWYGLSHIEPIAHVSESNRIIDEMDLKEINRSLWAGMGLIKTSNKDVANADRMLQNFQPGLWTITDLDTVVEIHQMAHDLDKMVAERSENDRRILRALEVPSPLVGFEEITNRATIEQILLAWKESVLEHQRTWFKGIIERQWFDTMTSIILNEPDVEKLKVKIKCEFQDITFETLAMKAGALIPLYEAGIIPLEKILKMLDMDDVIEQMRVMQEQYSKIQAKYIQIQQQQADYTNEQQKYNPGASPLPVPGQVPPMAGMSPIPKPQNGNGNGNGGGGGVAGIISQGLKRNAIPAAASIPRTASHKTSTTKRKYPGIPSIAELTDPTFDQAQAEQQQEQQQQPLEDEQAESKNQVELAQVQLEYAKKKLELISNLNQRLIEQSAD